MLTEVQDGRIYELNPDTSSDVALTASLRERGLTRARIVRTLGKEWVVLVEFQPINPDKPDETVRSEALFRGAFMLRYQEITEAVEA